MNIPAERVERIREFGYTEAEARFLYLVAVYSGYFTLGQFRAFAKISQGNRASLFAQKVVKKGHATVREYMRRGSIFHLFSRTVYGQMDNDNRRNRKRHSFDFMRARLLLLDFVLCHPELNYLETEQDKVRFFCNQLEIPKESLPVKVYEGDPRGTPTLRYFADQFPLFLDFPSGAPPVVTLSYVDSGFKTSSHFITHLAAYQRLFRELKTFRFVYIAAKDVYFQKAEESFRSLVKRPLESGVSGEILRYFKVRMKWERHEYVVPVTEDLEFLNEARRRFHGEPWERLFETWQAGKMSEQELQLEFSQSNPAPAVFFSTFLVHPHGSPVTEVTRRREYAKDTNHRFRRVSPRPSEAKVPEPLLPSEPSQKQKEEEQSDVHH